MAIPFTHTVHTGITARLPVNKNKMADLLLSNIVVHIKIYIMYSSKKY